MQSSVVRRLILFGAMLALPALAFAQEATLTGTITDSTGGVLPGVTVWPSTRPPATVRGGDGWTRRVSDAGACGRLPDHRATPGFSTVNRAGVNLLVGQTATVNMQMAPSTLQETVTVTGEAPLIETTTSSLAGNIDPKQVAGSAGSRTQLDGPGAARAREPDVLDQCERAAAGPEWRRGA